MTKMGKSLRQHRLDHYNNTYKELGKIDKDVVRISGGDNQAQPELIDRRLRKIDIKNTPPIKRDILLWSYNLFSSLFR